MKHFESLTLEQVCLSSITLSELEYGVQKSQHPKKNSDALSQFILPLDIYPFDVTAAHHYGKIRASLEKKDTPIGALDLMIAAHAKSLNRTIVTNNTKEFKRVSGLKVINWITH